MHDFVEYDMIMLISPSWNDSQPSAINNISILHHFVAPVTIHAAST